MNKKIFALLLLIFVCISISAVSAVDVNDDGNVTILSDNVESWI